MEATAVVLLAGLWFGLMSSADCYPTPAVNFLNITGTAYSTSTTLGSRHGVVLDAADYMYTAFTISNPAPTLPGGLAYFTVPSTPGLAVALAAYYPNGTARAIVQSSDVAGGAFWELRDVAIDKYHTTPAIQAAGGSVPVASLPSTRNATVFIVMACSASQNTDLRWPILAGTDPDDVSTQMISIPRDTTGNKQMYLVAFDSELNTKWIVGSSNVMADMNINGLAVDSARGRVFAGGQARTDSGTTPSFVNHLGSVWSDTTCTLTRTGGYSDTFVFMIDTNGTLSSIRSLCPVQSYYASGGQPAPPARQIAIDSTGQVYVTIDAGIVQTGVDTVIFQVSPSINLTWPYVTRNQASILAFRVPETPFTALQPVWSWMPELYDPDQTTFARGLSVDTSGNLIVTTDANTNEIVTAQTAFQIGGLIFVNTMCGTSAGLNNLASMPPTAAGTATRGTTIFKLSNSPGSSVPPTKALWLMHHCYDRNVNGWNPAYDPLAQSLYLVSVNALNTAVEWSQMVHVNASGSVVYPTGCVKPCIGACNTGTVNAQRVACFHKYDALSGTPLWSYGFSVTPGGTMGFPLNQVTHPVAISGSGQLVLFGCVNDGSVGNNEFSGPYYDIGPGAYYNITRSPYGPWINSWSSYTRNTQSYFLLSINDGCGHGVCRNGGTCANLPGGAFSCQCADGYYGATCDGTPCSSQPCQNVTTFTTGDATYPTLGDTQFRVKMWGGGGGGCQIANGGAGAFIDTIITVSSSDTSLAVNVGGGGQPRSGATGGAAGTNALARGGAGGGGGGTAGGAGGGAATVLRIGPAGALLAIAGGGGGCGHGTAVCSTTFGGRGGPGGCTSGIAAPNCDGRVGGTGGTQVAAGSVSGAGQVGGAGATASFLGSGGGGGGGGYFGGGGGGAINTGTSTSAAGGGGGSSFPATACVQSPNSYDVSPAFNDTFYINSGFTPGMGGGTSAAGSGGYIVIIRDINECLSSLCANGGTCVNSFGSFTCQCSNAYSGPLCQTDVDECASLPCRNSATCVDGVGSFACACVSGYIGVLCQTDINECSSQPCLNAGTCVDAVNQFTCICAAGWSGLVCQTNVNECASSPCLNAGTCFDAVNQFTCSCVAGWSGLFCQTNVDECSSTPCQNSGTCTDLLNDFTCACASGHSGRLCQTNVDECASFPCLNTGTCVDGVDSFACTCAAGYSGVLCQTDVNECASAPCTNGGTCADLVNRFTCTCPPGYSGAQCETNINECASIPCENTGTCIDDVGSFTCQCAGGYSGSVCQTDINECASLPCHSGGTCIDFPNRYACTCASGYFGLACESEINECASAPCENGGTCSDGINSFTCSCPYTHSGDTCSTLLQRSSSAAEIPPALSSSAAVYLPVSSSAPAIPAALSSSAADYVPISSSADVTSPLPSSSADDYVPGSSSAAAPAVSDSSSAATDPFESSSAESLVLAVSSSAEATMNPSSSAMPAPLPTSSSAADYGVASSSAAAQPATTSSSALSASSSAAAAAGHLSSSAANQPILSSSAAPLLLPASSTSVGANSDSSSSAASPELTSASSSGVANDTAVTFDSSSSAASDEIAGADTPVSPPATGTSSLSDTLRDNMLTIIVVAAAIVLVIVALYVLNRYSNAASNKQSRLSELGSALTTLFFFVTNLSFVVDLRTRQQAVTFPVLAAFLAFSCVGNVILAVYIIACEFGRKEFARWTERRGVFRALALGVVLCVFGVSNLRVLDSSIGGMAALAAPFSSTAITQIEIGGLVTTGAVTVPFLVVSSIQAATDGWTLQTLGVLIVSVIGLFVDVLSKGFAICALRFKAYRRFGGGKYAATQTARDAETLRLAATDRGAVEAAEIPTLPDAATTPQPIAAASHARGLSAARFTAFGVDQPLIPTAATSAGPATVVPGSSPLPLQQQTLVLVSEVAQSPIQPPPTDLVPVNQPLGSQPPLPVSVVISLPVVIPVSAPIPYVEAPNDLNCAAPVSIVPTKMLNPPPPAPFAILVVVPAVAAAVATPAAASAVSIAAADPAPPQPASARRHSIQVIDLSPRSDDVTLAVAAPAPASAPAPALALEPAPTLTSSSAAPAATQPPKAA